MFKVEICVFIRHQQDAPETVSKSSTLRLLVSSDEVCLLGNMYIHYMHVHGTRFDDYLPSTWSFLIVFVVT